MQITLNIDAYNRISRNIWLMYSKMFHWPFPDLGPSLSTDGFVNRETINRDCSSMKEHMFCRGFQILSPVMGLREQFLVKTFISQCKHPLQNFQNAGIWNRSTILMFYFLHFRSLTQKLLIILIFCCRNFGMLLFVTLKKETCYMTHNCKGAFHL